MASESRIGHPSVALVASILSVMAAAQLSTALAQSGAGQLHRIQPDLSAPPPLVVIYGNILFNEFLYRSQLDLPKGSSATEALSRTVGLKLSHFLHRAGYSLATVRSRVVGPQIVVQIDEGQLDKVVVVRQDVFQTIRLKLELSLPSNVFNRPFLEQRLGELCTQYHFEGCWYELAPVVMPEGATPEDAFGLEEIEPLLGIPTPRPGQRYELHIFAKSGHDSAGFSPDVEIGSPEGLALGGHYHSGGLLLKGDRWEIGGRLAGAIRNSLDAPSSRPVLSHALSDARWISSPVLAEAIRPALTLSAETWRLQRADLRLESFDLSTLAASADIDLTFNPALALYLRVGLERRFFYGIQKATNPSPTIDETPRVQTRPYVSARLQWLLNPNELRTDRKHRLQIETRYYTGSPSSDESHWLRMDYQHRFPFGWHELWIQAHGTLLGGQTLFMDEEPIGSGFHGPFGGTEFAKRLVGQGAEFRYALARDIFKVGLFYDQVFYGYIDRVANTQNLQFAAAGGPALHLLLADEFQCDFYLGIGATSAGAVEYAPALSLRQVF